MKPVIKTILLLPLVVLVFLASYQISFDKTNPIKHVAYSITVTTNPDNSGCSVIAVRRSDGVSFTLTYDSGSHTYYTGASGLTSGTYDIYICCGGTSGGTGVVTLHTPSENAQITINLTGGCQTPPGS